MVESIMNAYNKNIIRSLDVESMESLAFMANIIYNLHTHDNVTVYLVGNGGSSASMSHLASDLTDLGVNAICLTDNTPALTAKTNDSGWDKVYSAILGDRIKPNDILIIASVNGSSGKSPDGERWSSNLMDIVLLFGRNAGFSFGFIGNNGGSIKDELTQVMCLESKDPYIVEGVHSVWSHILVAGIKKLMERKT